MVGSQGVDMPDSMHLPQIDFPLIAVRAAKVPSFQRDRRIVALADGSQLVDLGRLQSRLRCKSAQCVALPAGTISRPRKDVGERLCFRRS